MAETLDIKRGPQPGTLGGIVHLHGVYYAKHWQFPVYFECKVARELVDFFERYDPGKDLTLTAWSANRLAASITIDGSDPTLPTGQAHLRWFVTDEAFQGQGLGKRLIQEILSFARATGFSSVYLTTFQGLNSAAHLYTQSGFILTDQREGETWGARVQEQRFELEL